MLSRTSTPTTIQLFMLSRATKNSPPPTNTHYYPAIHVEPDHQASTTIQQFMLSRATNTHFYPAIHVEPDHQAPTTIQLFMLSRTTKHPLLSSYSCWAGPPSTNYYPAIHVELAHIYHLPNTV
jgi:hypothetical protein